jgi:hypothetical protein
MTKTRDEVDNKQETINGLLRLRKRLCSGPSGQDCATIRRRQEDHALLSDAIALITAGAIPQWRPIESYDRDKGEIVLLHSYERGTSMGNYPMCSERDFDLW